MACTRWSDLENRELSLLSPIHEPCLTLRDGQRPSFFNMTARAKYDAWAEQFRIRPDKDGAKERYMEIAAELGFEKDGKTGGGGRGVKVSTMAMGETR